MRVEKAIKQESDDDINCRRCPKGAEKEIGGTGDDKKIKINPDHI